MAPGEVGNIPRSATALGAFPVEFGSANSSSVISTHSSLLCVPKVTWNSVPWVWNPPRRGFAFPNACCGRLELQPCCILARRVPAVSARCQTGGFGILRHTVLRRSSFALRWSGSFGSAVVRLVRSPNSRRNAWLRLPVLNAMPSCNKPAIQHGSLLLRSASSL